MRLRIGHRRSRSVVGPDLSLRERGETLIELMATVILMGTAVIGLISAMFTVTVSSQQFERASKLNLTLQEWAETLKGTANPYGYIACANGSTYPVPSTMNVPVGATYTMSVKYWAGSFDSNKRFLGTTITTPSDPSPTLSWTNTCTSTTITVGSTTTTIDSGVQQLTLQVKTASGDKFPMTDTVVLVKRDNRCLVVYSNPDTKPC